VKERNMENKDIITEAVQAVSSINSDLYDQHGDGMIDALGGDAPLGAESDGLNVLVRCFGFVVWSSGDDDRPTEGEDEDYIPLEKHLRATFNSLTGIISGLKVKEQ
jgi:hypothetical protein